MCSLLKAYLMFLFHFYILSTLTKLVEYSVLYQKSHPYLKTTSSIKTYDNGKYSNNIKSKLAKYINKGGISLNGGKKIGGI